MALLPVPAVTFAGVGTVLTLILFLVSMSKETSEFDAPELSMPWGQSVVFNGVFVLFVVGGHPQCFIFLGGILYEIV